MADIGRRGLLKLGGGVGLAGLLTGAAEAVGLTAKSGPALTGAALGQAIDAPAVGSIGGGDRDHPLFGLLNRLDRGEEARHVIAQGVMDPDIACLRSVSPAIKHMMQMARIEQRRGLMDRLRQKVWA